MIEGSALNRLCQSSLLSNTTRSAPGWSSSCVKLRPSAGSTPTIAKLSCETAAPFKSSGKSCHTLFIGTTSCLGAQHQQRCVVLEFSAAKTDHGLHDSVSQLVGIKLAVFNQ